MGISRCPRCGSFALREWLVPPLPGSASTEPDLEITCKEETCGHSVADRPAAGRAAFTNADQDRLDRASLAHSGLVIACQYGPPNHDDPFVRRVMQDVAAVAAPGKRTRVRRRL